MSDAYTLQIRNFRSIREASIDIAPLTVVYGPNGSGKSSLIYALLTLRNFLTNPNQNLPSLLSYPSLSLGGLHEVVYGHDADQSVALALGVSNPEALSAKFTLTIGQSGGNAGIAFQVPDNGSFLSWPRNLDLEISIPYSGNRKIDRDISVRAAENTVGCCLDGASADESVQLAGDLGWNGVGVATGFRDAGAHSDVVRYCNERANLPLELARQTGFVPLRRGFARPTYNLSRFTPALATEDEVASALASHEDRFRQYKVSGYIEQIVNRRIQTSNLIGTSSFSIDSIPTTAGTPVSIVNEGFGINQLVYMLTVCLYPQFKIVAIEEPEIHLHPSLVRKLAHAMAEIATGENRRLIVSTHSETFVVALLTQIAAGNLNVGDVSFIMAEHRNGESAFTRQEANNNGQLQGGLEAFIAAELEDLATFLGIDK